MSVSPPAAPIPHTDRIEGLDLLRGVALCGILFVNVSAMSNPVAWAVARDPDAALPLLDTALWALVRIVFEGKFVILFSLLFGMGLVLQTTRISARGAPVVGPYLRRLAALATLGVAHGLLLWFGDILFVYAMVGFVVLWCRNWSPRRQLQVGGALIALSCATQIGVGILGVALGTGRGEAVKIPVSMLPPAAPDWLREALTLTDPVAMSAAFEMGAYGQGPLVWSMATRGMTWVLMVLFSYPFGGILFGLAGLFLVGGALVKLDFFSPRRRSWHRRLACWGIPVGWSVEIALLLVAEGLGVDPFSPWTALFQGIASVSRPLLTAGYVGAILWGAQHPLARPAVGVLARMGRMALTNYLAQSAIVVSLMLHWGAGAYGQLGRPALFALVLGILALQAIASTLWLSVFRMGPLEWIWRGLTYLRLSPLRRRITAPVVGVGSA